MKLWLSRFASQILVAAQLTTTVAVGTASAGEVNKGVSDGAAAAIPQQRIRLPGTNYDIVLGDAAQTSSMQFLLTAIETWLSAEFHFPPARSHPQIEFASAGKISALRYGGLLANPQATAAPGNRTAAERSTVAVYSDAAQTIYLPERWTGVTPGELSVLVHEMVHHLQNVSGLKFECPQNRERLAYAAQDRWLGLFGRSLESEFELDPLSLLVKTGCLH
jgi:hypothetical protein